MKAKSYQIDALYPQINREFKAALIYGPDFSVVQDTAEQIGHFITPDLKDDFRVIKITPANIKDIPSVLLDEGDSLSLMGGRKLLWLKAADNNCTDAVENFVTHSQSDSFLLITADNLLRTSSLKVLCEAHPKILTIACYEDSIRDTQQLVRAYLSSKNYDISSKALNLFIEKESENRLALKMELNKLMTYVGAPRQITEQDVIAIIHDTSSTSVDVLCQAVAGGNQKAADKSCHLLLLSGETSVGIVRMLSLHFNRLLLAADMLEQRQPMENILKQVLKANQFKLKEAMARQILLWKKPAIIKVLALLLDTERQLKSTGIPDDLVLSRTLTTITNAARKLSV